MRRRRTSNSLQQHGGENNQEQRGQDQHRSAKWLGPLDVAHATLLERADVLELFAGDGELPAIGREVERFERLLLGAIQRPDSIVQLPVLELCPEVIGV